MLHDALVPVPVVPGERLVVYDDEAVRQLEKEVHVADEGTGLPAVREARAHGPLAPPLRARLAPVEEGPQRVGRLDEAHGRDGARHVERGQQARRDGLAVTGG